MAAHDTDGQPELLSASRDVERLDLAGLADLVRRRRSGQSLRQTADEIGVSFSTLSRVESGAQPDLTSFTKICAWLGVAPSQFFFPVTERPPSTVDDVVRHLHQDPRLSDQAATLIAGMLSQMYEKLASAETTSQPLLACHLRAASSLRPGVPERLASVLEDMSASLLEKVQAGAL